MANKITVLIDVVTDRATRGIQGFKAAVNEADGAVGKMKAGARSLGDALRANAVPAAAVAGAAALKFGQDAVDAASNLEESMNAVNVVFGDAADGIHELGESSVDSFGLSRRAFNEAAVSLSSFAKTATEEGGDVAATMDDLVRRAADFASVHNIDISQAVSVFQSTLAGETEAIRRYGGDVSAAAVEMHALETGLISSRSEMTEAIKVQARYSLLMNQTDDVAGDFANTQDSLANQSKTLAGNFEDLQALIGQKLVPVVTDLVAELNNVAEDGAAAFEWVDDAAGKIDEGLLGAIKDWGDAMASMFTNPTRGAESFQSALEFNKLTFESMNGAAALAGAALGVYADQEAKATRETELRAYWAGQATDATEDQASAERDLSTNVRELTKKIEDQLDAVEDLIGARRDLAGETLSAQEAELDFLDAVDEARNVLMDSEASTRDKDRALIDLTRATDDMVSSQLEANGVILDSEQGNREWTRSMLAAASEMEGPLARAILEHVARVNGIPEEKITEIQALLDEGDVDAARAMLDAELGKTQSNVDVDVTPESLQRARDRISRMLGRTISIPVDTYIPGRDNPFGGRSHTGSMIPAGDSRGVTAAQYAWFTAGPGGFRMPSNEQAKRDLAGGAGGRPVNLTVHVHNQDPAEVEQIAYRAIERAMGR